MPIFVQAYAERDDVTLLEPGGRQTPFNWTDRAGDELLRISMEGFGRSSPFPVSQIGEFAVKCRHLKHGEVVTFRVQVC